MFSSTNSQDDSENQNTSHHTETSLQKTQLKTKETIKIERRKRNAMIQKERDKEMNIVSECLIKILRENNITDDEVIEACEYVNANYFIDKLPNGLNEEVLERGNNYSSGQRQLLSFARTIAHKPKIMILDEATANIDTETEKLIQNSLEKMM